MRNRERCQFTNICYTASAAAAAIGLFGSSVSRAIATGTIIDTGRSVYTALLATEVDDAQMLEFRNRFERDIFYFSDNDYLYGAYAATTSILACTYTIMSFTAVSASLALLVSSAILTLTFATLSLFTNNSPE